MGIRSNKAWLTVWLSQVVVVTVRFSAVMEVVRRVLAVLGIWALGRRVLLAVVAGVLVYTALLSKEYWRE